MGHHQSASHSRIGTRVDDELSGRRTGYMWHFLLFLRDIRTGGEIIPKSIFGRRRERESGREGEEIQSVGGKKIVLTPFYSVAPLWSEQRAHNNAKIWNMEGLNGKMTAQKQLAVFTSFFAKCQKLRVNKARDQFRWCKSSFHFFNPPPAKPPSYNIHLFGYFISFHSLFVASHSPRDTI